MRNENLLVKAHKPGDTNSKGLIWGEYKPGKFDWRPQSFWDRQKGKQQPQGNANAAAPKTGDDQQKPAAKPAQSGKTDFSQMSKQELLDWAKKTIDTTLSKIANDENVHTTARQIAYDELKGRGSDVSKINTKGLNVPMQHKQAKVQYKQAPKVEINVPSKVDARDKNRHKIVDDMDAWRKKIEGYTDDQLLKIVGSDHMGNPWRQHLAYEEAASRGIDESKVKVGQTLKDLWRREEQRAKMTGDANDNKGDEDEDVQSFDYGLGDFDLDGFKSKFDEGDTAWDNPDNPIVKKTFDLNSLHGRKMYDRVRYALRTESSRYKKPEKQIQQMARGFLQFTSKGSTRPLCVCYGGAGVGKTYTLKTCLREVNMMEEYDPSNPNQGDDYDWVVSPQVNSMAKLAKQLNQHNGKIVIFDDNDDILTDPEMANLMKTLTDGDPNSRFFPEYDERGKPTGKNMKFTGKIIVLTNKSSDTLSKNEDAKAIMSRGTKMGLNFTVQENLEALQNRYKTMNTGVEIDGFDEGSQEDQEYRQRIFDFINDHKDELDPKTFTVRKFNELYELGAQEILANKVASSSQKMRDFLGDDDNLEDIWLDNLNKADDDDMNNDNNDLAFYDPDWSDDNLTPLQKKRLAQLDKKIMDGVGTDDDKEAEESGNKKSKKKQKKATKAEKALKDEFGMSLDEAEDLLLG